MHLFDSFDLPNWHFSADEKFKLEEDQRAAAREREAKNIQWQPRLFEQRDGVWVYKYFNDKPWNPEEEDEEYEQNFEIKSVLKP